jgi:membrane protein involved in colicin uptake
VAIHLPQDSAMKKLEMKDLTETEKAEIALLVQKAQANADHTLTNGERNKIREAGRLKIAADRAKAAKDASALAREKAKERAREQVLPDTFNWADSVSNKFRGRR